MPRFLILMLLMMLTLLPALADIPMSSEDQERLIMMDIDEKLYGLSIEQQRAKVQEWLSETAVKKAAAERASQGNGPLPAHQYRKQISSLELRERLLREWRFVESTPTPKGTPTTQHSLPPPAPIAPPVSPATAAGGVFLLSGLFLGGRRILRPSQT